MDLRAAAKVTGIMAGDGNAASKGKSIAAITAGAQAGTVCAAAAACLNRGIYAF